MAADALFPGKHFISTVLEALETKTTMSGALAHRYLMRAGMAGIIIGVFYSLNYAVVAAFAQVPAGTETLRPIGRLVGAFAFGWALVFIYYSKSELLTSNMMIVAIGTYHRRIRVVRSLRLLGLCYLGNALGGLLVALLDRFSTVLGGPIREEIDHAVATKLGYVSAGWSGWGDLFVRAVLCNLLINLAMLLVYNGLITDDLAKCLVMVAAVFVFAFAGLEHSVANTVLFLMVGLSGGIDVGLALGNIGIALLGNLVGGGVLVGLYYAYANDDRKFLAQA